MERGLFMSLDVDGALNRVPELDVGSAAHTGDEVHVVHRNNMPFALMSIQIKVNISLCSSNLLPCSIMLCYPK